MTEIPKSSAMTSSAVGAQGPECDEEEQVSPTREDVEAPPNYVSTSVAGAETKIDIDAKQDPRVELADDRPLQKQRNDRYILCAMTALTTCLFAAATLGWGPMQLMLEDDGNGDSSSTTLVTIGIMVSALQMTGPLLGIFVDKFGAKWSAYCQAILAVVGLSIVFVASILVDGTVSSSVVDGLLYMGFCLLALQTWTGSIMIVQLGLYFEGHTISRVIYILNVIFDAGILTYLALWGVKQLAGTTTSAILGGYLGLAVLIYGVASFYWTIAVPISSSTASNADDTIPSTDDLDGRNFSATVRRKSRIIDNSRRSSLLYSRLSYGSQLVLQEQCDQGSLPRRMSQRRQSGIDLSKHNSVAKLDRSKHSVIEPNADPRSNNCRRSSLTSSELGMIKSASDGHWMKHSNGSNEGTNKDMSRSIEAGIVDSTGDNAYVLVADRGTAVKQFTAAPFLLFLTFYGIQVALSTWNLVTQVGFLEELGDDDYGNIYLLVFTLIGPASIIGAPFMDWVVLHLGWNVAFQLINGLSVAYMTVKVAFSTNLQVQIAGFIIYSFYRSFLFGISYSYLPTLVGDAVVGRAAGIMGGCAGLASVLLIPLFRSMDSGDSDSGGSDSESSTSTYLLPNAILLCVNVPMIVVIAFLGRYMRLEGEAKEEKLAASTTVARSSFVRSSATTAAPNVTTTKDCNEHDSTSVVDDLDEAPHGSHTTC